MAHPAFLLPHRVAGTFPNDPKVPDQPRGRPPSSPYCYALKTENSFPPDLQADVGASGSSPATTPHYAGALPGAPTATRYPLKTDN